MDMCRRRHRRKIGNISIIYISTILALSFIGVGYAAWNSGLTIDVAIKTGFTKLAMNILDNKYNLDNGKLEFYLSQEKDTLIIKGEVYPSFNEEIKIEVIDEGSIPSLYNDIEKENSDITDLKEANNSRYGRMSTMSNRSNHKNVELFNLEIDSSNHFKDDEDSKMSMRFFRSSMEELSGLEGDIKRLKDEIRAYEQEEEYEFKYKLLFQQGL